MPEHSNIAPWLIEPKSIPLTPLRCSLLDDFGVELLVARLDLVDPFIQGNKWFKLKFNLIEALNQGAKHVVSFGGAYSNHLHALAAASHRLGLKSTAVLRGELITPLNPTLKDCEAWGMSFFPVSRVQYRNKTSPAFIQSLHEQFGDIYLIPEGGSNLLALKGMSEVADDILSRVEGCDALCCAVGSGGTLAGLAVGANPSIRCIGYSAIKGGSYIEKDIKALIHQYSTNESYNNRQGYAVDDEHLTLIHDYHFGGFAKVKPELVSFMAWFERSFDIPLEQVYTAKMFYGIFDQIQSGYFKPGQRIVALHTGGLQGRRGLR